MHVPISVISFRSCTYQLSSSLFRYPHSFIHPFIYFKGCPEEDWPVLIYKLEFDRASAPYVRTIVFLNILLNLAAFACFWIPPHVGERMGLAITCVLAAVAGELVVASMLPVCAELSWYNK